MLPDSHFSVILDKLRPIQRKWYDWRCAHVKTGARHAVQSCIFFYRRLETDCRTYISFWIACLWRWGW